MCVSITEKLEMGLCPVISSPLPLMMTMYRGSSDHSRKPGLMGSQVYPTSLTQEALRLPLPTESLSYPQMALHRRTLGSLPGPLF